MGSNGPGFPGANSRLTQSFNGGVGVNGSFMGGGGSGSSGPSSISSSSYTPALDYSFRNISSLNDLEQRQPRQILRKQRRSPSGRYNSNVIRLANNNLVDTKGLYKMALDVVEYPEDIAWLDLSFNDISKISDDILEFRALKMIYLHGNKIRKFSDLKHLSPLKNLYSITLHGNPIENAPNYRSNIISMFPDLKSLDFAKVTEDEKDTARLHIIVSKNSLGKKEGERREGKEWIPSTSRRGKDRELKKFSL